MLTRLLNNFAVVALLAGCALDNPCPKGTTRVATRCLPEEEADDSSIERPDDTIRGDDGSIVIGGNPSMDADVEEPPPVEGEDGSANDDADSVDTGSDGDSPLACTDDARDAWRRFQMSEAMVPEILTCFSKDPLCRLGTCDLAPCLIESAQVAGCDECVTAEVACAAQSCSVPCGVLTDDDACRACACANHCLDAPVGCGLGSPSACGDCTGASCSARRASATDTITVPIFFHLLHDRVDPATGLPAYAGGSGEPETILDIDAQLEQINGALDAARPDARRLRVIRAGVAYGAAPAADVCPDPGASTDARRLFGGLNVVLTTERPGCPALASSAFAGRANGASLLRTLGNLLGIPPAQQAGTSWQPTQEQFVRMHNYTRWRLAAADAVPESERTTSAGFLHGPADPIWDKLTNRDWALTNASVFDATAAGPFPALPAVAEFAVATTRTTRRVLGVRVSARFGGTPSDDLQIVISGSPAGERPIPRRSISVGEGTLVAEEAFDMSSDLAWHSQRNTFAGRLWRVSITDTADLTLRDIRLELVLGDRNFSTYDRHARGVSDIFAFRPSESQLLSVTNPANRTVSFGASVSDPVPPLPAQNAKVMSGDVDGDGQVDLLARRESAIWVSFHRGAFTPWREGVIAGTPPNATDDVLIGDFDADGFGDLMRRRADFATGNSLWGFHRGVGDGTFEAARNPAFAGAPLPADVHWTVGDFQRRGRSDVLFRQHSHGSMAISYNDLPRPTTSGATPIFFGAWAPRIGGTIAILPVSDRFIVLDANLDGREDIVSRRTGSGEWFVCLNQGSESFSGMQPLRIAGSTSAFSDTDTIVGSTP